jgi:ribosomal protein S18 acetylase RimI-like enzyme
MDIKYRNCTVEEFEAVFRDDHPTKEPWPDFIDVKKATHICGAEVDGKIRGAIAFELEAYEPIDDEGLHLTLSYLSFLYVSRDYRKMGIGATLLTNAIRFLAAANRTPIGCGFTSSQIKRVFEKLSPDLKQLVASLPTSLDDGLDIWKERNL